MSTDKSGNNMFPSSVKINRQVTVAVVDDHDLIREKIAEMLVDFGFTVAMTARNGEDLLEKLEQAELLPETCLLDISMPVINGFETAAELKRQYPQIRILAFSMDNDEKTVRKILECGAHDFADKNIEPKKLRDQLLALVC